MMMLMNGHQYFVLCVDSLLGGGAEMLQFACARQPSSGEGGEGAVYRQNFVL